MKNVVIVGGGISGIATALFLSEDTHVTLIEKSPQLGGLLGSENHWGIDFDYGTHLLRETGDPTLDEILFGGLSQTDWNTFYQVKAGNFFRGQPNPSSPYITLSSLSETLQTQAVQELLALKDLTPTTPPQNLYERSLQHFGKTITEHIVAPQLHKQFATALNHLSPNNPFFLSRVVIDDDELIQQKTNCEFIDARIAYPSFVQGVGTIANHYPKQGGIGTIMPFFAEKLAKKGVTVLCNSQVTAMTTERNNITTVQVNNNLLLSADSIVWTLPSPLLLGLLGMTAPTAALRFLSASLHHIVFNEPLVAENHFITNYDPDYKIFRVTLYPNLGNMRPKGVHNVTVECLNQARMPDQQDIIQELVRMAVIESTQTVKHYGAALSPSGFPVVDTAFEAHCQALEETIKARVTNLFLIGKASGKKFFMPDVLQESYHLADYLNHHTPGNTNARRASR